MDTGVDRATWAEALRNSQARSRGGERGAGRGESNNSNSDALSQRNRRGGGEGAGQRNLDQAGSRARSQQLTGSNDSGRGERSGAPRARGSFGGNEARTGATSEEVRNFLSLRERGGQNGSGGNDANRSGRGSGNRGQELARIGDGNRRDVNFRPSERGEMRGRNRDGDIGDGNQLGNGNRSGDGDGRGDGDRLGRGGRGDGNRGDGERGGNRRGGADPGDIGQAGDGRRGSGRDGDWRGGDGRGENSRGRDGDGRRWRGGELGKGDHRDWSKRWRDGKRFDVAHNIRDNWRGRRWRHRHDIPFHGDWWGFNRNRWHGGGWWNGWDWYTSFYNRPYFWWNWCSAPRLTTWLTFNWGTPYYWDYGPGEYINCYNDVIYVNGQWFEPAPVYYQRTVQLAQSAPAIIAEPANEVQLLPLGVFAVSRDGVVDNNVLVQLAVTKEGVISGNVVNQATGASFEVSGTVDKQSQRAAWTYEDETGKQIAMETSVYNLTQPESTAMLHNGPNDLQVVELVRLEQPNADAAGGVGAADAKPPVVGAEAPAGVNVAKPQAVERGDAELPAPASVAPPAAPGLEPEPLPIPPQPAK